MSHRFQFGLLAVLTLGARVPLAAQQDQMQHGEMQHDGMKKDGMGMGADAMGKDDMAMDHGMRTALHGMFAGSGGHSAGGSYAFITEGDKTVLKLGPDFSVEKAPDVEVVLSAGPSVSKGAVFLGRLSKFSGPQVFEVPSGTDVEAFSHLVLWSGKDKAALGVASLAGGGGMMHK
ncbi:MAG TPA: DM13 domain-containing protein [Gemmatimonadales bacterium]